MPAVSPPPGDSPDELALPVAAVARRLGVAPATLRTWDRRYGLGPRAHAAGAHRRYTSADLGRLEVMRRLTQQGVPPADAARAALAQPTAGPAEPPAGPSSAGPAAAQPPPAPAGPARPAAGPDRPAAGPAQAAAAPVQPDEAPAAGRRGGPGGRVLALPDADGVVRGIGRAAMALDSAAVLEALRAQLAEHGVVATWEHVLRPVLAAAGAYWAATGEGVEVEHLLSDCVAVALREVAGALPTTGTARPVLLAGAPAEQHSLPLHAVAAGLAERGLGSRVLGSALPADALHVAVRRTGAAVLFLWAQLPGTGGPQALAALPTTRPPTAVVVGGPGWRPDEVPERAAFAAGLTEALDLVGDAVGG